MSNFGKLSAFYFVSVISSERKTLLANFFSLSLIQATNYVLPLLVFPYLVRVLGIENFGTVAFAQTLALYLTVITDYGFNLSATREVAINKHSGTITLSRIYNEVMSTKFFLLIVTLLILLVLIILIPSFNDESVLYLTSFSIVIGQTLSPVWFFQGMEQMKYMTYLNVISKAVFTGLVFLLVKQPEDYWLANLLQGGGGIAAAFFSWYFIVYKFQVHFRITSFASVKKHLSLNWYIFISGFAINTYSNSNLLILGIFVEKTIVGYYSIAEKLINAIRQLLVVFSQVIYPYFCRLAVEENGLEKIKRFLRKTFIPFAALILLFCTGLFVFADLASELITGKMNGQIPGLIRLLAFVPFLVLLNIPAYQTLLAYDFSRSYSIILTTGSVLNVLLNFLLAWKFQAVGTAIGVLVTEAFITVGLYLILRYKHKNHSLF